MKLTASLIWFNTDKTLDEVLDMPVSRIETYNEILGPYREWQVNIVYEGIGKAVNDMFDQ